MSVIPVLLGTDLNAYSVAVSFHETAGSCSHAFGRYVCGVSAYSHIIKQHIHSGFDRAENAVPALLSFAAERPGDRLLLVPCADWYLDFCLNYRSLLSGYFSFLLPDGDLRRRLADKASFASLLSDAGIPHPRTAVVACGTEHRQALLSSVPYPAVLKPADSAAYWRSPFPGMKKVYFPENAAETEELAARIRSAGYRGDLILQERIGDGKRMSVLTTMSDRSGKVKRAVLGDVLLAECAPRAVGNYAAIVTRPLDSLAQSLIGLLDRLGYVGIANFDVVSDKDRACVLECNTRQGRSADYLRAAGVSLGDFLIRATAGENIPADFRYKSALWRAVSFATVRRYAEDKSLLARAAKLRRLGRECTPFSYRADLRGNPTRRAYSVVHLLRIDRVFKRYGGELVT